MYLFLYLLYSHKDEDAVTIGEITENRRDYTNITGPTRSHWWSEELSLLAATQKIILILFQVRRNNIAENYLKTLSQDPAGLLINSFYHWSFESNGGLLFYMLLLGLLNLCELPVAASVHFYGGKKEKHLKLLSWKKLINFNTSNLLFIIYFIFYFFQQLNFIHNLQSQRGLLFLRKRVGKILNGTEISSLLCWSYSSLWRVKVVCSYNIH